MREVLATRLAALAAEGGTVGYGTLARDLGCRVAEVTALLEAMMEEDAAHGRPFRAAVCAGRLSDGLPARGFYAKAAALGRPQIDAAAERLALKMAF